MRKGLRDLLTENTAPNSKSSRRTRADASNRGRSGGDAPAIRESATTSGGSVDLATKVRRYRLVRRRKRIRMCVFARIGTIHHPSRRKIL